MVNDPHGESTLESMSQAEWYNQWTLNKLKPYINGDILEVGCGIGNFTTQLTEFGKVTAIDIQNDYIPALQKKLDGTAQIGLGDIEKEKYFFSSKKFETIICLNVLEHTKNDIVAIENMVKLLKPGGYLLVLVPSGMNFYGRIDKAIRHYRRYNKKSLVSLMEKSGLRVRLVRILNILGAIGWFISGRILRTQIVRKDQLKIFNLVAPIILPLEDVIEPPFGTSILVVGQKP